MGHVDVAHLSHALPDGRVLLDDVSFRVGDGSKVALVGANGAGKTTLLRLITGDLPPAAGVVTRSGGLGVMRQFVGGDQRRDDRARPAAVDRVASGSGTPPRRLDAAELAMMERDDEPAQMRVRHRAGRVGRRRRLRRRGALGRLHAWPRSACRSTAASGARCAPCPAASRSGWCSSRCCAARRGAAARRAGQLPRRAGKLWLEEQLAARPRPSCSSATTASCSPRARSGSSRSRTAARLDARRRFRALHEARRDRIDRLEELRRRWDEEHEKLKELVRMYRLKASLQRRHGLAATRRRRPGCASSRRPGRPRKRRASRTSACGCAAAAPASAPSSASTSS